MCRTARTRGRSAWSTLASAWWTSALARPCARGHSCLGVALVACRLAEANASRRWVIASETRSTSRWCARWMRRIWTSRCRRHTVNRRRGPPGLGVPRTCRQQLGGRCPRMATEIAERRTGIRQPARAYPRRPGTWRCRDRPGRLAQASGLVATSAYREAVNRAASKSESPGANTKAGAKPVMPAIASATSGKIGLWWVGSIQNIFSAATL